MWNKPYLIVLKFSLIGDILIRKLDYVVKIVLDSIVRKEPVKWQLEDICAAHKTALTESSSINNETS